MKNLRFYNKEGYPYNFQYNEESEKWEGTLLFDPNSSDVYKTIGIYVFEHVEPIGFTDFFNFNKFELFNYSGITFRGETKKSLNIENIYKTNSSSSFYTKWVHGKGFHQLFPVGTVVKFENMAGNSAILNDFNSTNYFNVLGVKKDAFMVQTSTVNSTFGGVFYSGQTSSFNVIKYPDYNNNYYSMFNNSVYTDKKLSIVNSTKNEGVKGLLEYYTGSTLHPLKRSIYDYTLTGDTLSYINLELSVYTDRPIVYEGDFAINGNTITFGTPFKNSIKVGQEILFEDYNGNKLFNGNFYTVSNVITEKFISNNNILFYEIDDYRISNEIMYFAKVQGDVTQLQVGDVIYFSGITTSLNDSKDFKILNVEYTPSYTTTQTEIVEDDSGHGWSGGTISTTVTVPATTTLQLEQYVHAESGITYSIYNKLKFYEYNTIVATGPSYTASGSGFVYLTTNKLNFRQEIITPTSGHTQYEETINALIYNYGSELNSNGINAYFLHGKLVLEGLYDFNYNSYFTPILTVQNYDGVVLSAITSNNTYSTSDKTGVHYLVTTDRLYNESVTMNEFSKLAYNYYEEILFNLNEDSRDYGFTLTINEVEYYIPFQNYSGATSCTQETIKDFIAKYGVALYNTGINVFTGSTVDNKLYIETLYPNVRIFDLRVKVNSFSTYTILYKEYNDVVSNPILIAGNELKCIGSTDLFKVGLSTGMIISVTGATHNENQKEYNILGLTNNTIQLSYQGAFFDDSSVITTITSREYIRKPRESYDKDIFYNVSWLDIPDTKYDESIFFYDISGDQLKPPTDYSGNYITQLTYVGQKPLFDARQQNVVRLNTEPNTKLEYVSNPKYQQTVFDVLEFALPQLDSNSEYNYLPQPFEIFIGYNSPDEGVNSNVMIMQKIEHLVFSGTTGTIDNYFTFYADGTIEYKSNSFVGFNNYGFEIGQMINISLKDTMPTGQTLFENFETYEIKSVTKTKITIDTTKISKAFKPFVSNASGKTYNFTIEVMPKEIARFTIMGETEVEDERFNVNLKNMGININREEEKIFKESDISEYGIDYSLLNRKRKEMLIMYPEIYNYIGSYKSLINAINYFGYPDLEVYEYYRNVNKNSPLYRKYFRVHIPDMFDLSTEGWTEYDFIKSKGNRNNFQKTNMFNLTYKITDEDGNNLNLYSLQEVQIKLQSLKKWLRENILPLSSNIQDITGSAKIPNVVGVVHDVSNHIVKLRSESTSPVVNFNYITTLSFNTNYLFTINFFTVSDNKPESFELIVKTFNKHSDGRLIPVQYFKVLKTDLESFNLSIDKMIDPYIYIETTSYNEYGVGVKNHQIYSSDEAKTYYLINNNFRYKYYPRLSTDKGYYIIDDDGQLWIVEEYSNQV